MVLISETSRYVGRKSRSDDKRGFPKSPGMRLMAEDNRCGGTYDWLV